MDLFHIIDDAQAIIKQNGVFRQVKVYRRATEIYVASGSGFIKLMQRGNTSVPSVSWLDLDAMARGDPSRRIIQNRKPDMGAGTRKRKR